MSNSSSPIVQKAKGLSPRTTSWARIAVFLFTGVVSLFFLYQLADVLKLVVVSGLLAYLLSPFATWIESHGASRTVATLSVFLVLAVLFSIFSFYLFPIALKQLTVLQTGEIVEQAARVLVNLESTLASLAVTLGIEDVDLISTLKTNITERFNESIGYVPGVISLVGNLVIIPILMFFFIKDSRSMKKGFIDLVPNKYFEFSLNVLQKMDMQLGNYLRGQFLVALLVGSLSTLALWLLGVDFFLVIGPLAGLANMIPYAGPIIGALLAILASIITTGQFNTIPGIILAFIIIQLIDNSLLSPMVLARNVSLHPVVVLLAILIGGKLFGLVGLLLAVPFAAILKVIIVETLVNLRRYHI